MFAGKKVVLVTGGRGYTLYGEFKHIMDIVHDANSFGIVIHGDAKGADTLASRWCKATGLQEIKVPANWKGHGLSAGPRRNQFMIDLLRPDVVVAFPGGRGTINMMKKASDAGIFLIDAEDFILGGTPCLTE
jgi:hypothetical protein